MPVGKKFDIVLNGNGYMLSRATQLRGRAWQRSGQPDAPSVEPPRVSSEFGGLPSQLDHAEVWNDWSGGFGYAYRKPKDQNSYYGFLVNPNTYHWSENFDARFPNQLIHAQQMNLLDSRYATLNTGVLSITETPAPSLGPQLAGVGGVYILTAIGGSGRGGRLYPTGLDAAASRFDYGPISTGLAYGPGRPALFGSYISLPMDPTVGSAFFVDTLDDSNLGQINTLPGEGFAVAGNRQWKYWGAPGGGRRYFVNSVAVPYSGIIVSANYTATLGIGTQTAQINDMRAFRDQVFIGAEDGLYAGDQSGTFVNVLNDLAGQANAHNCRDIAIQNGQVIVQHIAGIYAYNPTITSVPQVREIGPDLHSNRSPIIGQYRTLEVLGPWLYAGMWTGSAGYLLAGRDEDGTGPYNWHILNRYPHVAAPFRLHVDGITTSSGGQFNIPNRMWAATDPSIGNVGTAPLYYWPIPLLNGNPLTPQKSFSANYVGSARIDLGTTDNRMPATPKVWRSVEIQAENLAPNVTYADVYYTLDGTGVRTLLGRASQSPRSVLYFPSTAGSFTTGYAIELSIESFTATQALTPIYRSLVLRSSLRPRSVDLITTVLDVADGTFDRQQTPMRPGARQLTELRALATQQAPVTLIDLAGATAIVEVLAPIEEQEVYQQGDNNPYVAATVRMAVLTFT